MELATKTLDDGIMHVALSGRLDIAGTGAIENKFTFQTATKKTAVLVDMSEVTFIASIGMRLLLSNARAQEQRGGKIVLYNPQELVLDALQTAGFEQLISIHSDYDAAVSELKTTVS